MRAEEAQKKAKETGKVLKFGHWEGSDKTGWCGSEVGTAYPCGCLCFSTILSDGSLGVGGWHEPCSFEHMDR